MIGCLGYLIKKDLLPGAWGSSSPEENFAAFREKKLKLPSRTEPVCLVAVGDIMLSRGVAGEIIEHGGELRHPLLKMENYLKSGNVVFGNLENPITPGREIMMPEMTLRADPAMEIALKDAGFTIHAGTEYEPGPDLARTRFARLAVDAGADLVPGHYPHVVQKIEKYRENISFTAWVISSSLKSGPGLLALA